MLNVGRGSNIDVALRVVWCMVGGRLCILAWAGASIFTEIYAEGSDMMYEWMLVMMKERRETRRERKWNKRSGEF
jgi:hypothetical protein